MQSNLTHRPTTWLTPSVDHRAKYLAKLHTSCRLTMIYNPFRSHIAGDGNDGPISPSILQPSFLPSFFHVFPSFFPSRLSFRAPNGQEKSLQNLAVLLIARIE